MIGYLLVSIFYFIICYSIQSHDAGMTNRNCPHRESLISQTCNRMAVSFIREAVRIP